MGEKRTRIHAAGGWPLHVSSPGSNYGSAAFSWLQPQETGGQEDRRRRGILVLPLPQAELLAVNECLPGQSPNPPDRPNMLPYSFSWGILVQAWITPLLPFPLQPVVCQSWLVLAQKGRWSNTQEFCKLVVNCC